MRSNKFHMICMFLSNEAVLKRETVDAAKFQASKGCLGLVNIPYHTRLRWRIENSSALSST
jgi:hypothetical protein